MEPIRVLLADDHHLFREGLANILDAQPDFRVVGEANDGLEVLIKARKLVPDLILMDIGMPGCDGVEATQRIKEELPDIVIVMLTVRNEDDKLFEAIKNGAQGYLLKSIRCQNMLSLLRGAMQGEAAITPALGGRMLEEFRRVDKLAAQGPAETHPTLTVREQQVLVLVAAGATNQEVADKLNLSVHTIKSHVRKILSKLQLTSRHEAASFARREGLVPPPGVGPD